MIALMRVRTAAGIPTGFRGKARQKKELLLLKAKRDNTLNALFKKAPWKPAKVQLRVESHNKCAYCESPAESQHGDVEHFRPKSIWWWLAMCYDNYLLSCQICNQSYKGDKFPLAGAGSARGEPTVNGTDTDAILNGLVNSLGPDAVDIMNGRTLLAYATDCKAEKALLIHPYDDQPEDFIIYEADATLRSVKVLPRKSSHKTRIAACEECFGINRESLCEQRWLRYEVLEGVWKIWQAGDDSIKSAVANVLKLEVASDKSFAGMARYFIREVWNIPGI